MTFEDVQHGLLSLLFGLHISSVFLREFLRVLLGVLLGVLLELHGASTVRATPALALRLGRLFTARTRVAVKLTATAALRATATTAATSAVATAATLSTRVALLQKRRLFVHGRRCRLRSRLTRRTWHVPLLLRLLGLLGGGLGRSLLRGNVLSTVNAKQLEWVVRSNRHDQYKSNRSVVGAETFRAVTLVAPRKALGSAEETSNSPQASLLTCLCVQPATFELYIITEIPHSEAAVASHMPC